MNGRRTASSAADVDGRVPARMHGMAASVQLAARPAVTSGLAASVRSAAQLGTKATTGARIAGSVRSAGSRDRVGMIGTAAGVRCATESEIQWMAGTKVVALGTGASARSASGPETKNMIGQRTAASVPSVARPGLAVTSGADVYVPCAGSHEMRNTTGSRIPRNAQSAERLAMTVQRRHTQ